MRIPRQLARRGAAADLPTQAAFDSYIGPSGELTWDGTRKLLRVHDGAQPGGVGVQPQSPNLDKLAATITISDAMGPLQPSKRITGATFEFIDTAEVITDFGPARVRGLSQGNSHGLFGGAVQNNTPGNWSYPCGVIAYGKLKSAGNSAFGLFGRVDQTTPGVTTNELNTFNYANDAPTGLGVSRPFGTTDTLPICLTVAAAGTKKSYMAIDICQEGSEPNTFRHGIQIRKGAVEGTGIFIDGDATKAVRDGLFARYSGVGIGVKLQVVGSEVANNAAIVVSDAADTAKFVVRQSGQVETPTIKLGTGGKISLTTTTQFTVGGSGVGATPPANPAEYFVVNINGVDRLVAAYIKP